MNRIHEWSASAAVSTQDPATLRLIEYCQSLGDEHLDATIPGTYGTIRNTLRHLVDSDEGYFSILTRERFLTKAAAAAYVRPDPLPDGPVPLHELAERIRRLGPLWEVLAEDADLPGREVTTTDGWRVPGGVPPKPLQSGAPSHSNCGANAIPIRPRWPEGAHRARWLFC